MLRVRKRNNFKQLSVFVRGRIASLHETEI